MNKTACVTPNRCPDTGQTDNPIGLLSCPSVCGHIGQTRTCPPLSGLSGLSGKNERTQTYSETSEIRYHGIPLTELSELAGKDWVECESDPAVLEAFAIAVQTRKMRQCSKVPRTYTATTV